MMPTTKEALTHPKYGDVASRIAAALGSFDMLTSTPYELPPTQEQRWREDLARCLEYAAAAVREVKP